MKPKILGLLAVGMLAGPITLAAPIAYDESVNGDIPGDGTIPSVTTIFVLDVGTNSVAGSLGVLSPVEGPTTLDVDYFRFVIPSAMELFSFSIAWSNGVVLNSPSAGITTCGLMTESFSIISTYRGPTLTSRCVNVADAATGSLNLFASELPLSSGTYGWIGTVGWSGTADPVDRGFNLDYVLSLGVRSTETTVPEPGTLALLGLGLAGLGLSRRRKAN